MKQRPFDRAEHVYRNDAFAELVKDAVRFFNGTPVLPLPQPPAQFIPPQREKHLIAPLALDEAAVAKLGGLPVLPRDPFDRMQICQAQAHGLALASSDP